MHCVPSVMNDMALAYSMTPSPAAVSCWRRMLISELVDDEDDFRLPELENGGVPPPPPPAPDACGCWSAEPSRCQWTNLVSASSNRTNAFRATSSTRLSRSSSAASTSVMRCMVGRRLDAARTKAVAAEFADEPISRIAVLVSARASVPVWYEEGEEPYLW